MLRISGSALCYGLFLWHVFDFSCIDSSASFSIQRYMGENLGLEYVCSKDVCFSNRKKDLFQDKNLFNRIIDNFGNLVYHKFSPVLAHYYHAWVEECLVFESFCVFLRTEIFLLLCCTYAKFFVESRLIG